MNTTSAFTHAVNNARATLTMATQKAKGADELGFFNQVEAALDLVAASTPAGRITAKDIAEKLVTVPVKAIQLERVQAYLNDILHPPADNAAALEGFKENAPA